MNFSDDWPENCPPRDAEDAAGVVFRIVKNSPPSHLDFLTHRETGRLPEAPPCLRCGLSVFREFQDVVHQRQLMPRIGKFIAKGTLQAKDGRTKETKGLPSHTTWWMYVQVNRATLFSVVQEVG